MLVTPGLHLIILLTTLLTTINAVSFTPIYAQGSGGRGIGGYDMRSTSDQSFPFDYDHSGRLDHIVNYRPGTGTVWIIRRSTTNIFSAVYAQGDPGFGIGGYDLRSPYDQIFPFDYDSSGKLDHLVLFRPGDGIIWILKNINGVFAPVFTSSTGIGGYDLRSVDDSGFAFDYNRSGKLDHLVFYRPGKGAIYIIRKNSNGSFTAVYAQPSSGAGIGGYDLKDVRDIAMAFDYDHSGRMDHMLLYRPGTGAIFILRRSGNGFTPVYAQGSPGAGIGGYDLKDDWDRLEAYDMTGTGKMDHLVAYRPGKGVLWVLAHSQSGFYSVFESRAGVGGYDLRSTLDAVYPFDAGEGRLNALVLYRPGSGAFWINRVIL